MCCVLIMDFVTVILARKRKVSTVILTQNVVVVVSVCAQPTQNTGRSWRRVTPRDWPN